MPPSLLPLCAARRRLRPRREARFNGTLSPVRTRHGMSVSDLSQLDCMHTRIAYMIKGFWRARASTSLLQRVRAGAAVGYPPATSLPRGQRTRLTRATMHTISAPSCTTLSPQPALSNLSSPPPTLPLRARRTLLPALRTPSSSCRLPSSATPPATPRTTSPAASSSS